MRPGIALVVASLSIMMIGFSLFVSGSVLPSGLGGRVLEELALAGGGWIPSSCSFPPSPKRTQLSTLGSAREALEKARSENLRRVLFHSRNDEFVGSLSLMDESDHAHVRVEYAGEAIADAALREELVGIWKGWAQSVDVICGYGHDVQDMALQNELNPDVFRAMGVSLRGYKLKLWSLKREVDVERNPGHFHFAKGRMFTVAWLNLFGRELIDLLGRKAILGASWQEVEECGELILARLWTDPFNPNHREKRRRQAAVREELGLDRVAHAFVAST